MLIECCEESGSIDLPFYIDALSDRIGTPDLILCLDSGCGNYEQLWGTTSLRGMVIGDLNITVLTEGIHSGLGSGIVPSPVMILRELIGRLEDEKTGCIRLPALTVEIPEQRQQQVKAAAVVLKEEILAYPFIPGVHPIHEDPIECLLNRSWRPALSLTGLNGLPPIENAGNVTIPTLTVKLSCRLPPTLDAEKAAYVIQETLEKNPPFGASVTFTQQSISPGWNAPTLAPWLIQATDEASMLYFNRPALYLGEGGTIPFMGMLGEKFPKAQFFITGVLGPYANAHGPNEFLHIPMAKKLTACIAYLITKHYTHVTSIK
jgi:acetylornithine deacetylase/succinyl-diaminopimelate desuccinylase-like protein